MANIDFTEDLKQIEEKLLEKATTQKKRQEAEKIVSDIRTCLNFMSESYYGVVFVRNLKISVGAHKGPYTSVDNTPVRNTQHELDLRIKAYLTGASLEDIDCVDHDNTLFPGATWVYMSDDGYICKCQRDLTVHFKVGLHGGMPEFEAQCKKYGQKIFEREKLA